MNRIKKGDLDLGMTTIHLQYQAYHGLDAWKDKPFVPPLAPPPPARMSRAWGRSTLPNASSRTPTAGTSGSIR